MSMKGYYYVAQVRSWDEVGFIHLSNNTFDETKKERLIPMMYEPIALFRIKLKDK